MPKNLLSVAERILEVLGFLPNNCLLNYDDSGDSFMGLHLDFTEQLVVGTGVAILSLGGIRSIFFRNKSNKKLEFEYPLSSGSLIYLTKEVQEDWLHAIPKIEQVEPRISLTFRSIVT